MIGKALIFESTLAVLKSPPSRTFKAIRHAATRHDNVLGTRVSILGGSSAELYSMNNDLVVLKQAEHEDRLTQFVSKYLPFLFIVR
jgi:hypothetical protein